MVVDAQSQFIDNHTKHINTPRGQNAEFRTVTTGGVHTVTTGLSKLKQPATAEP